MGQPCPHYFDCSRTVVELNDQKQEADHHRNGSPESREDDKENRHVEEVVHGPKKTTGGSERRTDSFDEPRHVIRKHFAWPDRYMIGKGIHEQTNAKDEQRNDEARTESDRPVGRSVCYATQRLVPGDQREPKHAQAKIIESLEISGAHTLVRKHL